MSQGKAMHNRKPKDQRPVGDAYPTPRSLVWELHRQQPSVIGDRTDILEPCAGEGSIVAALEDIGKPCTSFDLNYGDNRRDIFTYDKTHDIIVTNVPFTHWDKFVLRCKELSQRVVLIGRLNYFGTYQRKDKGIWTGLRDVYPFNRMVDYESPVREDGLFHVGGFVSGWFVWDHGFKGITNINVGEYQIDVNDYAKLGQLPRFKCPSCGVARRKKGYCPECYTELKRRVSGRYS